MLTRKEQANCGPLWPYMIQAEDDDGLLVWAWRGPEGVQGPWRESQAAALADLSVASDVPAHVREGAKRQYNEIATKAFNTAAAGLRGPGWEL